MTKNKFKLNGRWVTLMSGKQYADFKAVSPQAIRVRCKNNHFSDGSTSLKLGDIYVIAVPFEK
jgi:hypothetical protein